MQVHEPTVLGIDASSNSLAYGKVQGGELIDYGQIFFEGKDINERLVDVNTKINANIEVFDVDFIVIEKAVMVRNIQVLIKLSEFFGAIKSLILKDSNVYQIAPMDWQRAIGNPTITGRDKTQWCKEHPEYKTKSQILNGIRKYRKQITMDWVENQFGVIVDNDDIGDSIAIAWVGYKKLVNKDAEA